MGKPPTTYPEKIADQIGSKLDHLAQNPKGLQVKELIARLKPKIEAAQEAGYTLEDIVNTFKAEGVSITLNTLKQYLREVRASPSDPKPKKINKTPLEEPLSQSKVEEIESDAKDENKPRATNTDDRGFQRMRSDDEL